jgi:ribosomal protein S18 acetylase RimI-like enzyme
MQTPALLAERGFFLRALCDADLPWLCDLYGSTRSEEMALVPWPDQVKRQFLDQQCLLQHRHYLRHHGEASFLAIEHRKLGPVGNFYLLQTPPEHLIIHISLLPNMRGSGVGSALIRQAQADAAALGRGMHLHVLATNTRARALYERLGFISEASEGAHLSMHWRP